MHNEQAQFTEQFTEQGQIPPISRREAEYFAQLDAKRAEQEAQKQNAPQGAAEPNAPEVVVEVGNGRTVGELATVPQCADLSTFRPGSSLTTFEDPMAAVTQMLQAANTVIDRMDSDIEFQFDKVRQNQQAAAVARDALRAVQQKKSEYKIRSELVSLVNESAAKDFQSSMTQIRQEVGGSQSPNSSGQNGSSGCS